MKILSRWHLRATDTDLNILSNKLYCAYRICVFTAWQVSQPVWWKNVVMLFCVWEAMQPCRCCGCMARGGESAWSCLGSGLLCRGALWAMLCVSVSIHSRRGALSVLPRTRCQTPLPPPSMLPPRGQPAEWRTSLPGYPRTCVSHTHTLAHKHKRSSDTHSRWSVIWTGTQTDFCWCFLQFPLQLFRSWNSEMTRRCSCVGGTATLDLATSEFWHVNSIDIAIKV